DHHALFTRDVDAGKTCHAESPGCMEVWSRVWTRASAPGCPPLAAHGPFGASSLCQSEYSVVRCAEECSALTLLVARVALADHHDAAVAADHLAVIADRLDARVDLHVRSCSLS